MTVKTVNKSHCSMPVTQAVADNICGLTATVEMVSRYCVPSDVSDKLCITSIVSGI